MNYRAEYQLCHFAETDSVSYQYICVCLNLCRRPVLFELVFLYLLTKIDQIDPISLNLIAFYIQHFIVLNLMFYIFPDRVVVISKEGLLLNYLIQQKKKLPAIFVNAVVMWKITPLASENTCFFFSGGVCKVVTHKKLVFERFCEIL